MTKIKPFLFALCVSLSTNLLTADDFPAHHACSLDLREGNCIQILTEHPEYQTSKDVYGQLVLHIACAKGKMDTIKMLSQNKDLLEQVDNLGRIPLHYACTHFLEESVRLLVDLAPQSIHLKDQGELTPLHFATKHTNILNILLEKISRDHDLIQSLIDYASLNNYDESISVLETFRNPLPTN